MDRTATLVGLVGVYHAEGGVLGEAKYVIGRLLGTAHCGLCDITHSPVRRKPAWDRMVAQLGVPFELLHLNELPPDAATATARHGSPVVLARLSNATMAPVLLAAELDRLDGSVGAFETALLRALRMVTAPDGGSRAPTSIAPGVPGGRIHE